MAWTAGRIGFFTFGAACGFKLLLFVFAVFFLFCFFAGDGVFAMEWTDEALVLSARPHGETAAVVTLITPEQGRHAGLVPGGQGARARPILQPGNHVKAVWRARLADQLGHYALEPVVSHAARWLDDTEALAILASACAVTEASLPERQPMPGVYASLSALFSLEDSALLAPAYVMWEVGLLQALGYGLQLSRCAATGVERDLVYVSPKTGRALSAEAGAPYHDKLFALPAFLRGAGEWDRADIRRGLDMTGFFLSRHVFAHPHSRLLIATPGDLPKARQRLSELYHSLDSLEKPSGNILHGEAVLSG